MDAATRIDLVVRTAEQQSPVVIGPGALEGLGAFLPPGARRSFLVSDARVLRLHGHAVERRLAACGLDVAAVPFPPGEASKSRKMLARIQDRVLGARPDRETILVALGGGVTTDLAGLVAASLLRGLPLLNLPTTVVGVVDAAIGGKCGVDTRHGKNLVGSFHWPLAVVADTDLLDTLPAAEVRAGLSEMVKCGVIDDPGLLDALEARAAGLSAGAVPGADLLARAAAVKVRVVAEDPLERGVRRTLNFGHTVAHAIEAATDFQEGHGAAVAAGMVVEARIAERLAGFPAAETARIEALLRDLGLPIAPQCTYEDALPFFASDKKALGGSLRMALPERVGVMAVADGAYAIPVPATLLRECWRGGDAT
jgi:3-dehydroquinate synthase